MPDNDRTVERRSVLKLLGASAGASVLPVAVAEGSSGRDDGRSKSELVRGLRRSETYRTVRKQLADERVIPRPNEATVRETEQGYLLDIPTKSAGHDAADASVGAAVQDEQVTAFAEVRDGSGREYHASNPTAIERLDDDLFTASIVDPERLDSALPADLTDTSETDDGGVSIRSHLNQYWVVRYGWNYGGTFNEDTVCDVIGGADALLAIAALLANDITGVGVVDDYLIPAIGVGAAGCAIEDLAEEYLSGYLNCQSYTWVYEIYWPAWWNPEGPIIVPKCK